MIKQNPFSLFDFLGYLIPGALVCYIILLFVQGDNLNNLNDFFNVTSKDPRFQLDKVVLFIIVSYCIGHLISYLSSITVEKYLLWEYGYPSKRLLDLQNDVHYFDAKKYSLNNLVKFFILVILFPVSILNWLLCRLLKMRNPYTKPLEKPLVDIVKQKISLLFFMIYPSMNNENKDLSSFDFNRLVYHYVYENSKNHQGKLTNYVALYGFLRALAFIGSILFVVLGIKYFCQAICLCFCSHCNIVVDWNKIGVLVSIGLSCYCFFMAYAKFYRRYSLECMMALAIDKDIIPKKSNEQDLTQITR